MAEHVVVDVALMHLLQRSTPWLDDHFDEKSCVLIHQPSMVFYEGFQGLNLASVTCASHNQQKHCLVFVCRFAELTMRHSVVCF